MTGHRRLSDSRLRIVVTGVMATFPTPGLIEHYFPYVLGLTRLGHDVLYLEDTGWHYDPITSGYRDAWNEADIPEANRPPAILHRLFSRHGLEDRWTWVDVDGRR